MKLKEATKVLIKELKKHPDYRQTWKANIAMCYKDSWAQYAKETTKTVMNKEDRHIISNNAAEYFLQLLCDEIKYPEGR